MNVWPSRPVSTRPKKRWNLLPKKGCKDQSKYNNACPDEPARCYLLAVVRPAVDQRRLKQPVSVSPDASLACQGGGYSAKTEHLLRCLLNSLRLQQHGKLHKSSFKRSDGSSNSSRREKQSGVVWDAAFRQMGRNQERPRCKPSSVRAFEAQ